MLDLRKFDDNNNNNKEEEEVKLSVDETLRCLYSGLCVLCISVYSSLPS